MIAGLKWGAIIGVIVYAVEFGLSALLNLLLAGGSSDPTVRPIVLLPVCMTYFVLIFAFSASGFYTGRETGKAGFGALAGVVTLAVQYVLGLLGSALSGAVPAATTSGSQLSPVAQILAKIVALLLVLGLAACIGWLGGRPGAQRSARRAKASEAAPATPESPVPPA
jgi:hypothetical protein